MQLIGYVEPQFGGYNVLGLQPPHRNRADHRRVKGPAELLLHLRCVLGGQSRVSGLLRVRRICDEQTVSKMRGSLRSHLETGLEHGEFSGMMFVFWLRTHVIRIISLKLIRRFNMETVWDTVNAPPVQFRFTVT